jgi:hypothetical protein
MLMADMCETWHNIFHTKPNDVEYRVGDNDVGETSCIAETPIGLLLKCGGILPTREFIPTHLCFKNAVLIS